MKANKFDKKFDDGNDDVIDDLDLSSARRPNQLQKRVNVDFPTWMIESLDREASRIGVTRQSIIKVWLAERLEQLSSSATSHEGQSAIRHQD
ncbi:type II toxin-antitoxin system BrnA family antitoxin [Pseudazoarcus pumilus]|uniref:CopG family transcriptional regulator n=1 Tax=Pseudazoarcus pumilus TaxID=2067960 RepID=A0A2I6S9Y9_9RHOO|nr:CopG family transcriptional regulator [Pseudazoarcus pumilus]AUN96076.1 CopG family transcriptional regulator [Pseudazoarcus pumilus]